MEYDYEILLTRLKEMAYLNKGLRIILSDERQKDKPKTDDLHFEGGIRDFLSEIADDERVLDDIIYMDDSVELDNKKRVEVEIAMTYTISQREMVYSFVNNINTHEGGTHVSGYRTALTRVLNEISKQMGLVKDKDGSFQGSDVREGLVAILSIKIPEPQFEGQTKTKLGNSEITGVVSGIVGSSLKMYLEDHPKEASNIIEKILMSKKEREAAKKAKPILLEPIFKVEVTVPEEYMGDVIGDLNSRRGRIEGMEARSGAQVITAFVPLSEMFGYATDLRSKTQGRGNYSMEVDHYEDVPKNIAEAIVAKTKGTQA